MILLLVLISFPLFADGGSLESSATLQLKVNLEQILEMKVCDQSVHKKGAEGWESLEPLQSVTILPGENKSVYVLVMTNANCGFTLHADVPNLTAEGVTTQIRYEVGAFGAVPSYEPPVPPEGQPTYVTSYPAPGEGYYDADHEYGIPHGLRIMSRGIVFFLYPQDYEAAVEGYYSAQVTVTLVVD